jgi:hypothetical protein
MRINSDDCMKAHFAGTGRRAARRPGRAPVAVHRMPGRSRPLETKMALLARIPALYWVRARARSSPRVSALTPTRVGANA